MNITDNEKDAILEVLGDLLNNLVPIETFPGRFYWLLKNKNFSLSKDEKSRIENALKHLQIEQDIKDIQENPDQVENPKPTITISEVDRYPLLRLRKPVDSGQETVDSGPEEPGKDHGIGRIGHRRHIKPLCPSWLKKRKVRL